MKKSLKIDENFFLVSQEIAKESEVTTVTKTTNHIFIVDVSGSMYYDLPLIRKQLKNKLSNIMREGDTITIIWFSGNGQAGVLKEEVEVKSLKTLTDLHDAIDKWLTPVGLTAFLKPLELTKDVISRIKANRPDSVFSLMFLTDGYNNDCPWNKVITTLKSLEGEIASSTFVEYGYYADTQKLTQMASVMGGEKISTSDFDDFEPVFEAKISTGSASTKKIVVPIAEKTKYDFAYSIDNGSVLLYSITDGEILVGDNIKQVYFFTENLVGTDIYTCARTGEEEIEWTTAMYAAIYVLSDKLMNFEAEKVFYPLGDNYHYKMLVNAFGKQKLNAFKSSIKDCVVNLSSRFPEGAGEIKPVADDAYCLMNLISDLGNAEGCLFYPGHESFQYNRIGRKMEAKGSELSDKEKQMLSEAKNVDEANKILEDLKKKNVDLKFTTSDPKKGYPITDLVWNESRANLSIRVRYDGSVELPENDFGIDHVSSFKYNTYTLIKDGIVNVEEFPVTWSEELENILKTNGVKYTISTIDDVNVNDSFTFNVIIIDLKSIPVINRGMVKEVSAEALAKLTWELTKLQGEAKVYNHFRKELFPKESKSFIDMVGEEAANWLKEIGITDYNGFAPKRVAAESTDAYMAVNLDTKIKGLSSLPKVEVVAQKLQDGKPLKVNEWVMSGALTNYMAQMETEIYQTLDEKQQNEVLKNYIIKKSQEMTTEKRKLMQQVAEIKFSLILSKKWFKEFNSFDENKLDLTLDGQSLSFTFDLNEKEVKI